MKKAVAVAALGLSLISSAAIAAERATDAALGAVSGAVVLGPIGVVAGAFVGYTAGPSISRSWSSRRPRSLHQHTTRPPREARASVSANPPAAREQPRPPSTASAPPPPQPTTPTASTSPLSPPPVQPLE